MNLKTYIHTRIHAQHSTLLEACVCYDAECTCAFDAGTHRNSAKN